MWVLYVIKKAGPAHLSSSAATLSAAPAAPVDLRAKESGGGESGGGEGGELGGESGGGEGGGPGID